MLARSRILAFVAAAAVVLLAPMWAPARSTSVGYEYKRAAGIPVHVTTVDLNDPEVRVALVVAAGGVGRSEGFRSMLRRTRPAAAAAVVHGAGGQA